MWALVQRYCATAGQGWGHTSPHPGRPEAWLDAIFSLCCWMACQQFVHSGGCGPSGSVAVRSLRSAPVLYWEQGAALSAISTLATSFQRSPVEGNCNLAARRQGRGGSQLGRQPLQRRVARRVRVCRLRRQPRRCAPRPPPQAHVTWLQGMLCISNPAFAMMCHSARLRSAVKP